MAAKVVLTFTGEHRPCECDGSTWGPVAIDGCPSNKAAVFVDARGREFAICEPARAVLRESLGIEFTDQGKCDI